MLTLQQIKDSLPKYCCLTSPDIAKEGDVVAVTIKEKGSRGGEIAYEECEVVIRPIPDEVLDNQAWWLLARELMGPNVFVWMYNKNYLSASRAKEVERLGGADACEKHSSAGDLYSKWLGEQLT